MVVLLCRGDPDARTVDISNLGLESLPLSLLDLPKLTRIDGLFVGNPLSTVPDNIKRGPLKELLQYLHDIQDGNKVRWGKTKVMVLGKEGSGKTHILKLLRNLPYERNQSTNGIDINTFILDGRELTWFDFGGQEVFYPTHQFFLTPQCVYIIVFRLNDDDFMERVQHWLRTVARYTTDPRRAAKILVVGTHLDALASPNDAEQRWDQLMPLLAANGNVVAHVNVSCPKKKGVSELKDAILQAIENSSFGAQMVPGTYIKVASAVAQSKIFNKKKLDFASFCWQLPTLNSFQVEMALKFLMDAGVCFFDESLMLVVTDLQWLADVFKQVVSFYSGVKDGVVKLSGLKHDAWKGVPDKEVRTYMVLLEKFHMAFPQLEKDSWVVPSMLKEMPVSCKPKGAERAIRRFERTYDFEAMPSGAMGRLMVRLQNNKSLSFPEMWRDGMHVQCADGSQVGSIVLEKKGSPIRMRVSCFVLSQGSKPLIQVLSEECTSMLNDMYYRSEEKPFKEFISCPHCLAKGTDDALVVRLPKIQCAQWIVESVPFFSCGSEQVPVRLLGPELTLGENTVFDDNTVVLEREAFASGAFGLVFRARMGEAIVVVKELNPAKAKEWAAQKKGGSQEVAREVIAAPSFNGAAFEEFQHEASLMSRLHHDNIVRLHGMMLNPLRLVMEYCFHGDLLKAMEKELLWNGPVPLSNPNATIPPLCEKIILDVARGMAFLQAQQPPIAHRDLRSPNVFLVSLNHADPVCAKVADFGLSVGVSARQTQCLSTWQWMAPEAQLGSNYTHLCDVYSFGIVANEVLTQRIPFIEYEKMPQRDVFQKLMHEQLRPTIPSFVPTWMREMIGESWQHDPNARPTMAECVHRLEHGGDRAVVASAAQPRPDKPREKHRIVFESADGALLCMSHNAEQVWVGCRNGNVLVFSTRDLKQIRGEKQAGKILSLCSPTPSVAFSGTSDGATEFWTNEAKPAKGFSLKNLVVEKKGSLFGGKKSPRNSNGREIDSGGSAPTSSSKKDVTVMTRVSDIVLQGCASGDLKALSLTNQPLATGKLNGSVSCACSVAGKCAWVGVGRSIHQVTYRNQSLGSQVLVKDAHSDFVLALVCTVRVQVWSATSRGEVCVWDAVSVSAEKRHCFSIGARLHSMCAVEMQGVETVWIGCDDEIRVFETATCSLRCVLPLPHEGEVTCMANVSVDVVWVGVRNRGDKGSLYVWDFSQ